MFIIKNGEAYLIDGKVAKKATFSVNELKVSDKEEDIVDIKGEQKYTYDEVYKKLNVAFFSSLEAIMEESQEEPQEESQEEPEKEKTNKKNK